MHALLQFPLLDGDMNNFMGTGTITRCINVRERSLLMGIGGNVSTFCRFNPNLFQAQIIRSGSPTQGIK